MGNRALVHPLTMWFFFIVLAVGVVVSSNSIYALAAISLAALIVKFRGDAGPWRSSFRWSLYLGLYLLVIRLFTSMLIGVPIPGTTLFTLPRISLPTWLPGIRLGGPVTLERLTFSMEEAIIIATVIALFGAANAVTSPHKLLRTLPASVYQISVALTIATSILPQFIASVSRIREAQFLRNGLRPKLISIAVPLLEESLSRSAHLAESMESRGYGLSRTRSRYRPFSFSATDISFLLGAIGLSLAMALT
jgi:energy-coupling factor transport system permease protein